MDGPNTLRFTYDGAGRLTTVEESVGFGLWWPLRTFTYADDNLGFNLRRGKLWEARAYNHLMIGSMAYTAEITETYGYAGKQGRVSVRDTAAQVTAPFIGIPASFTQSWTWNDLGDPASVSYPVCTRVECTATATRTVTPTYTNGFLTSLPGYTSPSAPNGRPITYHPNGQVNQVFRANDTTDTYTKDPQNQPRPRKIEARVTSNGTLRWSSALLSYDGAGNLTRAGNAYYLYDPVSRVKDGLLYLAPGGGGATATFDHAYDGFGNLQSLTTNATTRNTPTSISTNRLLGTAGYDAAGNLVSWGGASYEYDALNQMWGMTNGAEDWLYLYTADGERLWSYQPAAGRSRWTVRDLDGKVLREYKDDAAGWSIERDYVYRGSQLLAAHTADPPPNDLIHLHPDHLGTPRAITNQNAVRTDYHVYFPFGEEASSPTQDVERMKFTGHERDLGDPSSPADDLDYMHARFYNPQVGRFLRVDPKNRYRPMRAPQQWNRYAYAIGNPLKFFDPNGEDLKLVFDFRDSGLSDRQQTRVTVGIRQRFTNAGVRNVQISSRGSSIKPTVNKPTDRVVVLRFTNENLNEDRMVYGKNRPPSNRATVSTVHAPPGDEQATNFLINVGAHEAGHASRALPQYDNDQRPLGSILNPRGADEGSVMEQGVPPEVLGAEAREFSDADAGALQEALNEPEEPVRE